jgi:multiple sugar transport system permease protein
LLFVLFLVPTVAVIVLSLFDWQLGSDSILFVGGRNFAELSHDEAFRRALANSFSYTVVVTPITLALGLLFAIAIQSGATMRAFYRSMHFLPYMATLTAMAIVWESLLHPTIGLVNSALSTIGLEGRNWLRDPSTALWSIGAISIWQQSGYAMVIFLAGLNAVPPELYEAAELDGVNSSWGRLTLITLPQLAPITLFLSVVMTLRSLSTFSTVEVLTEGGPEGRTEFLLYRLYVESFGYLRAGYGAAIACVFLVLVGSITLLQFKLSNRRGQQ